jgi:hypothetical protein
LGIEGQKVKAELRPRKYRSLVYALCNEQKTLVDSHVVPRFFLRAVTCEILEGKRTGQRETSVLSFGDKPQSRDVQEGSFERSHGLVQKLLCRECDSKIGRWESYARITLYGNSPGPDIRKQQLCCCSCVFPSDDPELLRKGTVSMISACPTKRHYRYEKAHEASSNIISAIPAIKLIPRFDLRIRRLDSGALFFSSRLNGAPLTASTKRKSFTCRF